MMSASCSVADSGATASYTPPGGSPSVLLIAMSPTHCRVIGVCAVELGRPPAWVTLAVRVPGRGAAAVD